MELAELCQGQKLKVEISLEEYKEAMKGVYTTSVNEHTLDEAPMAYKSLDDIIDVIKETVIPIKHNETSLQF